MKIHSPSMSELHAFVTAVRLGSFTRAADQLCVTQGAVSRAVSRLESHLGVTLVSRTPTGLTLTAAGRRLLEGTASALDQIEQVSRELRVPAVRNTLRLAVVPTLASVWLMPRLPDFHRQYPDIRVEFCPYRRDEDFSGDGPHAAILAGIPGERAGWRSDYIIGREVVAICHPERLRQRRAEGRWKAPAELLREPLLRHANAPENWANWFRAVGVLAGPPEGPRMDQVSIIVRAVMADIGLAVLQRCLVQEEIDNGRVAVPFDLPVQLQHGYILCSPERNSRHPALTAFREWLLETAGHTLPETTAPAP
ncbi:MAG TPA: LysR substrate-binding domain-containing protein [Burkholderiaceae bacterium]|nr:LysR substrate-binding domain-containing protein [Burkholderiaceae bacterium]